MNVTSDSVSGLLLSDCDGARVVDTSVTITDPNRFPTPIPGSGPQVDKLVGVVVESSEGVAFENVHFDVPGTNKRFLDGESE